MCGIQITFANRETIIVNQNDINRKTKPKHFNPTLEPDIQI